MPTREALNKPIASFNHTGVKRFLCTASCEAMTSRYCINPNRKNTGNPHAQTEKGYKAQSAKAMNPYVERTPHREGKFLFRFLKAAISFLVSICILSELT